MRLGLSLSAAALVALGATRAARAEYDEETFEHKSIPTYSIPTPRSGVETDTVIGQLQTYRVRRDDTLLDIARYYDVGYNQIVDANPGIDPWVPPAGAIILLPTEWVLPCCTYEGIIVNIPELRLYYYQRAPGDPGTTIVHTYPVGLGRDDWRTPRGKFRVRGKTVNPTWVIPESIRQEHIKERGDDRKVIPGGAPDNPLGNYRLELTLPMYSIHGTDIPWGVGMQVSHGCVRLYPEDIERLFPLVPVGTPGEFAYEPIKAGKRNGTVYAEVHKDIYGYTPALYRDAVAELERRGLSNNVDQRRLEDAIAASTGVPVPISPDPDSVLTRPVTPDTTTAERRADEDVH